MDLSPQTRPLPTLFVVVLAVGVGTAWLLALLFLGAMVFGSGSANPLNGLMPATLDGAMQVAVLVPVVLTAITILAILGFGTVALISLASGSPVAASASARVLVWILTAMTGLGWLAQAATPLAFSESILLVLPILLTALPTTAVQMACLVLAAHYLRPQGSDIF